jgi:hypothetical protein
MKIKREVYNLRLTAVMPRQDQASALIDTLDQMGYPRKDLIVTNMSKSESEYEQDPDTIIDLKSERDGFGEKGPFTNQFAKKVESGILVSVEAPEKHAARLMQIMEENGAVDIIKE